MKKDFVISGMSCAACVARVEKAARSANGVNNVTVNLLTGDMRVEGDFDASEIIAKVKESGYGARLRIDSDKTKDKLKDERKKDIKGRVARLIASASILVVLFTVSMSYSMKMPMFEDVYPKTVSTVSGIIQAVLSLAVILVNYRIFVSGFKGIVKLSPNMDSLVATGVAASFGYSLAVLISVIASNDSLYRPDYYFESSAMILTFMGIGKLLEAAAKGRATDAVSALKQLVPDSCTVLFDGSETVVPTKDVNLGDIIVIKPGDRVALDCDIISGVSEIDESAVTGESVPVFKKAGDKAVSGTVNITGVITAKVTAVSGETTVDRMAELVREIASTKAPIAKIADKVAGIFVPAVMAVSLAVFIIWMIAGRELAFSLSRAVSVLVVSCPCALGLATPVAIICGSAAAAKRGVLFKSSEALEICGRVKTVMFDKTGTITQGNMRVFAAHPAEGVSAEELVKAAALCELGGTHPIAAAITSYAKERYGLNDDLGSLEREFIPGKGATVKLPDGSNLYCGKPGFLPVKVPAAKNEGFSGSVVYVSSDEKYLGDIMISDVLSASAKECMDELHRITVSTVMLTGDNETAANSIAAEVGIDEYRAGLLPSEKAGIISEIQKETNSKVAMVGDGINDAPALTAADAGIAIGRGTDIAIESADVVITGTSLRQVSGTMIISRKTLRIIYENLFWAFGYNIIGIPLAAGLFSLINESFVLSPAFAAVAMSVSSILVVTNSLRLLAYGNKAFGKLENMSTCCSISGSVCDIMDSGKNIDGDEYRQCIIPATSAPEEKKMVTTRIKVKGMMCHNCERHVNNAVKGAFDVVSCESSFENEETIIVSAEKLDGDKLREVIKEEGYETGDIVTE
ncbi:MAG: heavy metal translocating P-type ATPase [Clostridia bacterium]|nr:heavy metal translocating P-type ATPase [Clostridia bacterium]